MRNLRALLSLALLDLRLWFNTPSAVISAILPPLAMALLLAVLAVTVTEQPVALVVEAHGPYATRMEQLIRADEEAYILSLTDSVTAHRLLRDQEVAAIITIPADFDRKAADHEAVLHLKLNNVDIDFADDIRRSVDRCAGTFDAPGLGLGDAAGEAGEKESEPKSEEKLASEEEEEAESKSAEPYAYYVEPGTNPYHIHVEEHDLRVTKVDFLHYQLIPVLVLLVLNVGMTGTALLCASDGERGTARLLLLAPISSWALVAGRMLGGLLASLIVLLPVLWIGMATRTIATPDNHWIPLVALFLVIALCASGLGAGLGSALRGARNVAMASSILATYLFLMGGGFTTIAFLPPWLRSISALNPMRYAIDGLRAVLFYPDLPGYTLDLAVLTGTAAGAVLIGVIMLVHSWRR